MINLLPFVGCLLLLVVDAADYNAGSKLTLEDIEREYNNDPRDAYIPASKAAVSSSTSVSSPTKFGFIPHRTANSYSATKPKYQYSQNTYQVKKPTNYHQPQIPSKIQSQYTEPQQEYSNSYSVPDYSSQQYSQQQQHQYLPQQDYSYIQPQQHQYQFQPSSQQYQDYQNVQYVTDNSVNQHQQPESQQTYLQPQYYYIQQSPSTAVESVVDPKGLQYVMFVPSYAAPNSISTEDKPPSYSSYPSLVATSSVKTSPKNYKTVSQKSQLKNRYVPSSSAQQFSYKPQQEVTFKTEPKSLLDSYVPSSLQLQYLKQHGKNYPSF